MRRILLVTTLSLGLAHAGFAADTAPATQPAAQPAADPSGLQTFGKPLQGLAAVKLADILARPEAGQKVRLEGTVATVCQNKGCWMELKQGEQVVHVTFEGYSFFVPKDSAGRAVVLEGLVRVAEPDPATVEHLQKEGAGEAAARKVSIEATGVELRPAAKK